VTFLQVPQRGKLKQQLGMACEKAKASGYLKGPIAVISCGDDVGVGKKGNGLVGRRGLQGHLLGVYYNLLILRRIGR
jgi:hypothetical protein